MKATKLKFAFIASLMVFTGFASVQTTTAASYSLDVWWANYWDFYGNDKDTSNANIVILARHYNGLYQEVDIITDLEENGDNGYQSTSMWYQYKMIYFRGAYPVASYTWTGSQNLVGCQALAPSWQEVLAGAPIAEVCLSNLFDPDSGGGGPPRYFDP